MSQRSPITLPADVAGLLDGLRAQIRRYVCLEGAAAIVALLGAAFWVSIALDYGFELARPIRAAMLILVAFLVVSLFLLWILLRVSRAMSARALALVLERRFPALDDRLITSVEMAEQGTAIPPLTIALLQRALGELRDLTQKLHLSEVFNSKPLLRMSLLALLGICSVGVFSVFFDGVVGTWFRRNLLLADEYYSVEHGLTLRVLAEPGERVLEFQNGVYKHPRGADLNLIAQVVEGKKKPEFARVSYSFEKSGGGQTDYMAKIGEDKFRYTVSSVHESMSVYIRGGDFRTRTPFRIEVVDPPRFDQVVLNCQYPLYTGKNEVDPATKKPVPHKVELTRTSVDLPAGTVFEFKAKANKKLRSIRVMTPYYEVLAEGKAAKWRGLPEAGQPGEERMLPWAGALVTNSDSAEVSLLFHLKPDTFTKAEPQQLPDGRTVLPLGVPENSLRILLHDEDDVISAEPIRLSIRPVLDEPPSVKSELFAIGNSITRQATIPVKGEVTDDYGVALLRFDYRLEANPAFNARPFKNPIDFGPEVKFAERFEVKPLELQVGQKLIVTVFASDRDDLTGPHEVQGEKYVFSIVTDDELLAQIGNRELNLRKQFEQILDEVKATRAALARQQEDLKSKGLEPSAERALNDTRKNANETTPIEEAFQRIRDELENNAIPDIQVMIDRLDRGIIKPLKGINTLDFPQLDDSLIALQRANNKAAQQKALGQSIDDLDTMIRHMEEVLAQMIKLQTINEALQMLRDIIQTEEDLLQKTKRNRIKDLQ